MSDTRRDSIALLSEDCAIADKLRQAFARTQPAFSLDRVRSRDELMARDALHLILIDLTDSREPALETLRWLRTLDSYSKVPIVALASGRRKKDADQAYAVGANCCLVKDAQDQPFDAVVQGIAAYAGIAAVSRAATGC